MTLKVRGKVDGSAIWYPLCEIYRLRQTLWDRVYMSARWGGGSIVVSKCRVSTHPWKYLKTGQVL